MSEGWADVDDYIAERLVEPDDVLSAVLEANGRAGLPPIDVSPAQGRFLTLIARMAVGRRILEIGTLGGYSTICLARGLPPDGRVVTIEAVPAHAAVARANFERAGIASRIDLRTGLALDCLPAIESERTGPFDLVFIDADKENNPAYLEWALRLSRPGTVIIVDNVVRGGAVVDRGSSDSAILGTRSLFDLVAAEPRLSATALQTVGIKGWDGFLIALVEGV